MDGPLSTLQVLRSDASQEKLKWQEKLLLLA
jgi:hypothetical protein